MYASATVAPGGKIVKGKMTDKQLVELREQIRQKMKEAGTMRPLPKEGRADRREKAAKDKAYFLQTYCPHYFPHPFSERHRAALQHCDTPNMLYLLTAHRNWGKSVIGSLGDQLDKIVHEKRHFFLLISNTEDMAEPFVAALKIELEENPLIQQDFGNLVGSRVWTSLEFVTRNDRKVLGRGIMQPFRGLRHGPYRPDDVTFDDVENDQTAENPDQCKKIERRIWKAVRPALQRKIDGGFCMKWIGTPITEFTITYQFMKDAKRPMVKDIIPIVDEHGASTWPEVYDQPEIDGLRADDPEAWFSEYLLNPLSGNREFQDAWLRDCETLPAFTLRDVTYGAVDPSFGHTGDYKAAIVLTGQRSTMNVYVRDAWLRNATPREMCQAIYDQQCLYDCEHAIEENTLKDFLWEAVEAFEKDKGVHLRLRAVYHGAETSKKDRIRRLVSPMERGKISFQKGQTDQERLKEQFKTFPKGHDDGPDAMEEAYQQILRRIRSDEESQQLAAGYDRETANMECAYTDFDGWI